MNNANLVIINANNYIGTYNREYVESLNSNKISEYIYLFVKRFFDVIISIIGIIFTMPLYLIIKIAYLLDGDTFPVMLKQERIGKNGNPITIFKFRSMIPNAEKVLDELMEKDPKIKEEYLRDKKLENDPRITKIGKIIRKTSIDEFPQFINVFLGDMSIVGPRPYLYREKEDMGFYYRYVIKSKPGITGMWQVSGRNNVSFYNRLLLDKHYEQNKSISLDTKIFLKTFASVIKREGSK